MTVKLKSGIFQKFRKIVRRKNWDGKINLKVQKSKICKNQKFVTLQKNRKISEIFKNKISKIEKFTKVKFIKIFIKIKNL